MVEENEKRSEGTSRWMFVAVGVLAVVSLIALGISLNVANRAMGAQQALTAEIKTLRQTSQHDSEVLAKRLEQTEGVNARVQGELSVVAKRLRLTQGELKRAREEAARIREENAKQIATLDNAFKGELATKASADQVNAVSSGVTGVRTDLDTAKKDLQKELQMARSELGTLIARNHGEIEQLRRLGERDYFEFTLAGKGSRQKVGDITVELRGTNPRKSQFTVALYVNDLRFEKRNRLVNEPVFFLTRGSRAPLELVINQVAKDKVVGYLSVPKGNPSASGS